jgi:hypothetical protein
MQKIMHAILPIAFLAALATIPASASAYTGTVNSEGWVDSFDLDACEFSAEGECRYFFLRPGYKLTLQGEEDGELVELIVTVLNETRVVDGVETRVVEEYETVDGELAEISRNFFVVCAPDNDIFYFGEDVDIYEDGEIVSHEGAWLAGVDDATPGVIVPASPKVGDKFYSEFAPGVAEDRVEVQSLNEVLFTSAGLFEDVMKVEETTALEPGVREYKLYASGVGLVQDGPLLLVEYELPEVEEQVVVELKPIVQSLVLAGENIQVQLMSNSTISEFRLEEVNKRVNFRVDGETGTRGTTEIPIGKILEGPYTVTIDGQPTSDFEVISPGSEDAIIAVSYTHSVHDVAITGTNVVPEFPISLLIMAAALGSIVILVPLARHRFRI